MGTLKKALVLTGLGGGLLAGGLYLRKLKSTSKQLETISKVSISSIGLKGLMLRIDLIIKNPSSIGLTIKFPFVRLMMAEDMIGSSEVVNQDIKIPAYGEAHIDKIMVAIPLTGLLTLAASLFMPLQSGQAVKIHVITITSISVWWMNVAYEKKEEVTLKTGSNASENSPNNTARKKIPQPNSPSQANGNNSQAGGDGTGHGQTDSAGGGTNQGTDQEPGPAA
jgi:hypothetical protein